MHKKVKSQLTLNQNLLQNLANKLCDTMLQFPIEIIQGATQDISFAPSLYMNSAERLQVLEDKLIFNKNLTEPKETYAISSCFERNDEVFIKMQLTGNLKNIWIGVMADEHKNDSIYWFKSGNQISLNNDVQLSKD